MKKMLLVSFVLILFCPQVARSKEISAQKEKQIRELMELTGASKMGQQASDMMLASFRKSEPLVEDAFWDGLKSDLKIDELMEKIIPIYDKYYSEDDLKALNAFYKSPIGQKVTQVSPQVVRESMTIGQEWGRTIGTKVAAKIAARKKGNVK